MTPNDILNKKFERATVGGYRADDVNAFILSVSDEMKKVLSEKEDLQKKLVVLADKLEEYRSDEESMRSALLGAQKLGDSIVKDSKDKAEKMLEDAVKESESIVSNSKNESAKIAHEAKLSLETENYTLSKLQREVVKFKKQILALYQQQVELIGAIPYDEESLAPPLSNPLKSNIIKNREMEKENLRDDSDFLSEDEEEESSFEPLEFGDGFGSTTE